VDRKYNKFYIGLEGTGSEKIRGILRPKKTAIRVSSPGEADDLAYQLEKVGFDVMRLRARWGRGTACGPEADLASARRVAQAVFRSGKKESYVAVDDPIRLSVLVRGHEKTELRPWHACRLAQLGARPFPARWPLSDRGE